LKKDVVTMKIKEKADVCDKMARQLERLFFEIEKLEAENVKIEHLKKMLIEERASNLEFDDRLYLHHKTRTKNEYRKGAKSQIEKELKDKMSI